MTNYIQNPHSCPTNPGSYQPRGEENRESIEAYNGYSQYPSSMQYYPQYWQHQDTTYTPENQQHKQTQQQQFYTNNNNYNNNQYFYSVPEPPHPRNPEEEEQTPSVEPHASSSHIVQGSVSNSYITYSPGSSLSTQSQDSIEERPHHVNNNFDHWNNNAYYWNQQNQNPNGYYNQQFHPSNNYSEEVTTGNIQDGEQGFHYEQHSYTNSNVAQYTDFSAHHFFNTSGLPFNNNNNPIPSNDSSPPNVNLFSSQASFETQTQKDESKELALNLNLGGSEINACILPNTGTNNIKSYSAIKNKKPSPKMKKERKKRASPHEHIPHTRQNDEKKHICEFNHCGYMTDRHSNILRHIRAMHVSHYIICCNQLFPTKTHFEDHRHLFHSDGKFICLVKKCGRDFTRKALLHKHEDNVHSDIPKGLILCSVCMIELPHPEVSEQDVKNHAITHSTE